MRAALQALPRREAAGRGKLIPGWVAALAGPDGDVWNLPPQGDSPLPAQCGQASEGALRDF